MERNLLVLGASSDLALAVLKRVAGEFDTVFAHYHRSADKLEELRRSAGNVELFQADFTNEEETAELMERVAGTGVTVTHILHCPSARIEYKHFKKLTWEDYAVMLNTQVRSFFYAARAFAPAMAKRRYGKFVTVLSSAVAGTPPTFLNAYVTAKYALLGCVKSLAAEYADKNVQFNAVSPSMMDTKFLENVSHLVVDRESAEHPLGRNASVEDIAPVIEFLLSPKSDFLTGQNLLASGGSVI